jgi:hypothetical protein
MHYIYLGKHSQNFDGEEVNWTADIGDSWASVQISGDRHTFVVDYSRTVPGAGAPSRHYRKDISVGYDNFIAGHTYQMIAAEGAEAGGFSGLFTNMLGAMRDTVNQSLSIQIIDVAK